MFTFEQYMILSLVRLGYDMTDIHMFEMKSLRGICSIFCSLMSAIWIDIYATDLYNVL